MRFVFIRSFFSHECEQQLLHKWRPQAFRLPSNSELNHNVDRRYGQTESEELSKLKERVKLQA